MSTTVVIAIVTTVIAFFIGLCVGVRTALTEKLDTDPNNPVKTFNAEPPIPIVKSKLVLPKRISKAEYDKRVNACLKDAVTKAVKVFVAVSDKAMQRRIIKSMYNEEKTRLSKYLVYSNFNPDFQRLDIIVHKGNSDESGSRPYSLCFDALWTEKLPSDYINYARKHK